MSNEERLVDLLQRLLGTCELNLEDMEPDTIALCQEATEFLTDNYPLRERALADGENP